MFRSSCLAKIPFLAWLRRGKLQPKRGRRPKIRLGLEVLEYRLAPAVFAEAAGTITLSLSANNEALTIISNGPSNYFLTTNSPNTFFSASVNCLIAHLIE